MQRQACRSRVRFLAVRLGAALALVVPQASAAAPGDIGTYAGGGVLGDGGPATGASLNYPQRVAADASGNLYIADTGNHRVRKVSPSGVITTVAGNGTAGFCGDGGPATSTCLNYPTGVATDSSGNLLIADSNNQRVRKVSPSGVITTVAGSGAGGFCGDGGPATSACLYYPQDVATDASGTLYIADTYTLRIRKVSPSGVITTVAGNGTAGSCGDGGPATSACLSYPFGVAADSSGNLLIADTNNHRVRKVSPSGVITTVAGSSTAGFCGDGGPATSACLVYPRGVATDASGNLLIADSYNQRVRKVSPSGVITTMAGSGTAGFCGDGGPATSACLYYPQGVAADASGNLLIADTNNQRVRMVSPSGVITTVAGTGSSSFCGDGGPATSACLYYPYGVAADASGNLYIAEYYNYRVRKVSPSGVITTVAGNGTEGFCGDGGPATSACLRYPSGVATDSSGNLYIADAGNNRVRKVSPSGVITTVAGNGAGGFCGDGARATNACLNFPTGVAADASGNLYIADSGNNRVRRVVRVGGLLDLITTVAGNGAGTYCGDGDPATTACLNSPFSVATDALGNLYIADTGNRRIRKVVLAAGVLGVITTVAGNGAGGFCGDGGPAPSACLNTPYGVATDSSGNLYIADTGNHRIRRVSATGVITTVVGNGTAGFCGDGGPAPSACLNTPYGVATDSSGNLYIADVVNRRIRRVEGPIP